MKSEQVLKVNMKATFKAVDIFCEKAEKLLRENNLEDYIFPVQLLLREALTNAVVHGCRNKPGLIIKSTIIIYVNMIIIKIEDPGAGFDWKAVLSRDYSISADSGRGLIILNEYASEYKYNKAGNSILIKKIITRKE